MDLNNIDLNDIAQHWRLTAPFVAAAPIYTLFKFLNRKASQTANRAVTAWIKGERYKQIDLKHAVVEGFDNLYGTPLLSWRSFFRSDGLSTLAVLIYYTFLVVIGYLKLDFDAYAPDLWTAVGIPIGISIALLMMAIPPILCDYVSLFVVRKCLALSRIGTTVSILLASVIAFCAITAVVVTTGILLNVGDDEALSSFLSRASVRSLGLAVPALLVHLWLPLLLIAGTLTYAFTALCRTVGWAQPLIKRGSSQPFDVIGIVAGAVVLVGTALVQIVVHFLPG